ncbi:MAG: hypothetical protein J7M30_07565 [Deltaproteobacteria bacterium]|nr:hypothetical protein [Deltaproteobacteria bacterium]
MNTVNKPFSLPFLDVNLQSPPMDHLLEANYLNIALSNCLKPNRVVLKDVAKYQKMAHLLE